MDKTDGKHPPPYAGRPAGSPVSPGPAGGVSTLWNGRSTTVGRSSMSSSADPLHSAAGQPGARTWAQVAAQPAARTWAQVAGGPGSRGLVRDVAPRVADRRAAVVSLKADTKGAGKDDIQAAARTGTAATPRVETKADRKPDTKTGTKSPAVPLPDFRQHLAACLLEPGDDAGLETGWRLADALRGPGGDARPATPPAPARAAFCQAWVAEIARTTDPAARDRLFDALDGFLGGMPSTADAITPLLDALARLPLAQVPQLAAELLGRMDRSHGLEALPDALARAHAALPPRQRPALAVVACAHAATVHAGSGASQDWDTFLQAYPQAQVPEAHLGARMSIDPMAVFDGDVIAPAQRQALLDAVYAIPGLVTEGFIQGSFATAWGVEVTPAQRQRLLEQLMNLGQAWVQPGHARVNRTILDADCRYAAQPMPTPMLEQVGRWYAATLARAEWDRPQQRREFLEGERRAVLRMPVADPQARLALLAVLAEPEGAQEDAAATRGAGGRGEAAAAPVRRADGKVETKSRPAAGPATSLDDDEA